VAARRLIGDLLRQIEPALESSLGLDVQEARRLWTLCRSEPPALRRLARQLYRARSAR